MAINHFFQGGNGIGNTNEKNLYEDLIIEGLKIYGHDVYYLPRTLVNRDLILGEDSLSKFDDSYLIEMYVETTEGLAGEQELINKFGLEIREETTFMLSKRRWNDAVDSYHTMIKEGRPNEGDIIYYPLMNKFFEISFVEDQEPFFQLGNLPVYKLRARTWEYSSEKLDTGVTDIDSAEDQYTLDQLAHQTTLESGTFRALGTTSLSSSLISPSGVDSVSITKAGEYTTAPTVTFGDPTGGGNETEIVKFGSRAYDGGDSGTLISTTGLSASDEGAVEFWFYVAEAPANGTTRTIARWGSNDAGNEQYRLDIQTLNGDSQIFYYRPISDTTAGTSGLTVTGSASGDIGRWNWIRLSQTSSGFNQVAIHYMGSSGTFQSTYSSLTFHTQIYNGDGFNLNADGDFSDGQVFVDELRFTSDGSITQPTLPTSTSKGLADTVFFQDGERVTATGTAVLTGSEVTSVTITKAGSNYTSAPTVTFAESDLEGSIILENDSASGETNYMLLETYAIQTQSTYAQNLDLDSQAGFNTEDTSDDILDFTERNPFGSPDF